MKRHHLYLFGGVLAGMFLAMVLYGLKILGPPNYESSDNQFPLLAKRLFLEEPNDTLINFSPLRAQILEYLQAIGKDYSFYFEYLPTGTSIRSGEDRQLVAASLMKIPAVMNVYHAAELGRVNLDEEVVIEPHMVNRDFQMGTKLEAGTKITLRQAAKVALIESNNTAARVVIDAHSREMSPQEEVLPQLDVELDARDESRVLISAKAYTSFLKCLYFSCYLSKTNSHELLEFLSQSAYDQRIEAGLPSDVRTAHKIGSFSQTAQSDCGIVYIPKRNFTVCLILVSSAEDADKYIADVSKMIYEFVSSR